MPGPNLRTRSLQALFDSMERSGDVNREIIVRRIFNICANSPDEAQALRAAEMIFNRWFGSVPKALELTGADGESLFKTPEAMQARIVELLAQARGNPKPKPKPEPPAAGEPN